MERQSRLKTLHWGSDLGQENLPIDEVDFLRMLAGPTLIIVPGADPTRTRVATTLLHGNEPSGLRAMHRWLRSERRPATNAMLLIACVDTALQEPVFTNRHLPERRDFNRCFSPPWMDEQGELAKEILSTIKKAEPDCLVDLHNNTGHNPAYGVAVRLGVEDLALVDLFADRVVHAPLTLGTLVEGTIENCPSVTIECGRSGDPVADVVAQVGLGKLFETVDLDLQKPIVKMKILDEPIRVCVSSEVELAFGDSADPSASLTISADIDRHNFELLPAGAVIGWIKPDSAWPLDARRPDGTECSRELFCIRGEVLETCSDFIPIMMTTKPVIAKSDCLFYATRESRSPD
jgi:hypothetical protein